MKCSCQRNEDEEIVVLCDDHQALIEAEREACAKVATGFLVGDPHNGVPFRSPTPHEIADAIRARSKLHPPT